MIALITSLNAPLIAWVLSHSASNHSPRIHDYQFAFLIMIGFIILGLLLCALAIKETYYKSTEVPLKLEWAKA